MAIESRNILRTFFETGDVPTADQFGDVIDSYIHQEDDNVTIYLEPGTTNKRFGIGNKTPEAPLGINATGANEDLASFNKTGKADATWFFNLNPSALGDEGFNIDQVTETGNVSRLFIQELNGNIGLGTTQPDEKLHIEASTGEGITGLRILNTATVINQGFVIGHENSAIAEENGALSIYENTTSEANKRLTIRAGGKVGINELIPDTKLHVSRDVAEAGAAIDLIEGTGIVTIGPVTQNVVADYEGIQARTGVYVGSVLDLSASTLNFQRVGGDILIHGDDAIALTSKGIITDDARLGLGTITPSEKIEIAGAIKIGNALGASNGTIRYTGSDFEGRNGGVWMSLTGGAPPPVAGPWTQGLGNEIYYVAGTDSRVGIGTASPAASLEIDDGESSANGNTAALVYNHAATSGTLATDTRCGMEIKVNGTWAPHDQAKNVGLYISDVSGQPIQNGNIGAAINGNVVIGDIIGSQFLGAGANRVLSIQNGNGAEPSAVNGSVQIYSKALGLAETPTLHVKLATGDVVKLYKEAALSPIDSHPISNSTYTEVEAAVINNLRDRLNELEARLQNIGILG